MAFWQRKNSGIFVYVYQDGKQRSLPRDKTRHLDHETDSNINAWVQEYARNFEKPRRALASVVPEALKQRVEEYVQYLRLEGKDYKTTRSHEQMLLEFILPYFSHVHHLEDPNAWPKVSAKFRGWMREQQESEYQIRRANSSLRGFWGWMADEGLILGGVELRLRTPKVEVGETPLQIFIQPQEVLTWVKGCKDTELKLMALLGYFFSLRPQEIFALTRADFRAGSTAQALDCCKAMARIGMCGKLAVKVDRQRDARGNVKPPKAYSKGWVACFDLEAAKLVVSLLNTLDTEAPMFQHQNDWSLKRWRREGFPGATLKDLRRASLHWLGHHTDADLVFLKHHARHSKPDTTLRYLRRPGEEPDLDLTQDFDLEA